MSASGPFRKFCHDIGIEPARQSQLDRPIEEAAPGAGLVEEFGRIRGIDIVIAEGRERLRFCPLLTSRA